MLLNRFCEEISQTLFPLLHEISVNYKQDKNYKAEERAVKIKELNIIREEVNKNIKQFDTLALDSEEYLESGFAKFLSSILSQIEQNYWISKGVCESISSCLPEWLKMLRKFKGIFGLYVIEVLFEIDSLKSEILSSDSMSYVGFLKRIEAYNSYLRPIDPESVLIIKKIFSKDYVRKLFVHLVPQGKSMENIFESALFNTFIVPLPKKVYGKTLVNLTIFIRDCMTDDKCMEEKSSGRVVKKKMPNEECLQQKEKMIKEMEKVFNAIIFCHEFAHVLQRSGCSNFGETADFNSPNISPPLDTSQQLQGIQVTPFNDVSNPESVEQNLNCFLENQELPVKRECAFDLEEIKEVSEVKNFYLRNPQEKKTKKNMNADTGFRIEILLFGQIVKFLNYKTALLFYEPELPNTLEELKNHFRINNTIKHPKESMKMNRMLEDSFDGIIMGKCGMSGNKNLKLLNRFLSSKK
ncbi:hypothetical protein SteCoe_12687 [Stentor coeruleus]|uniref:Uncharacterized protein n=1 Tax=Stentor coeruleus TaxID=5963 RepID=A0A1R2CA88_9CILI|nr:hypothetical protein SteCoe_12687 [Stentor coeruleus]